MTPPLPCAGEDTAYVYARPYGDEYEFGPLCQAVSLTDAPPIAVVDSTVATWHTLCEFQVLPKTSLHLMKTLRLTGKPADGDSLQLFNPLAGCVNGRLSLVDASFNGLRQGLQLFSPLRVMEGRTEAIVECVPVWKIGVDIEAWMRLRWSTQDLILNGIGRWVDDLPVAASALFAAVPVSGVQRWGEEAWVNAGLCRPWIRIDADNIRINEILVEVVPKGGVAYLNLHQVPRWVIDALAQGSAPNQVIVSDVRARPRRISDMSVEVRVEVTG